MKHRFMKNRPEKQVNFICSGAGIAKSRTIDRPRLVQAEICIFLYVDVCSRAYYKFEDLGTTANVDNARQVCSLKYVRIVGKHTRKL
jgi:hypothetical protein